jgi:hypothetical protein
VPVLEVTLFKMTSYAEIYVNNAEGDVTRSVATKRSVDGDEGIE